jgi:hypothetical protein
MTGTPVVPDATRLQRQRRPRVRLLALGCADLGRDGDSKHNGDPNDGDGLT